MSFTNFPSQLVPLIQTGFLARFLEEGLDSELAYRRQAILETIPGRLGQGITLSRVGRKPPVPTQLLASNLTTNFDNGLSSSVPAVEQYSYNLGEYGDTIDVDIMGEIAGIADQLKTFARTNGVQAAQTLERIAKNRLFGAYNTGNSYITSTTSPTTTSAHVDDIRGFQTVLVNGVPTPVSGTNPLLVQEVSTQSGGVTQTLTVTAVTADGTNHSVYPSDAPGILGSAGISGVITFNAATLPIVGDALIAAGAATVLRPNGKVATVQLSSGDVMTLSLVLDAVTVLRNNAVPVFPDATYHCILDYTCLRQLFADQQFLIATASMFHGAEYMSGQVFRVFDVTFIPTTEAYVGPVTNLSSQVVTVHRPILMGAESLLQGNFEGLELWLNREGIDSIGNVMIVDGIAQILRPPLDRLQRVASLSWTAIVDFAVPTDLTCNQSVVPTSSSAAFKRCVVMEVAG